MYVHVTENIQNKNLILKKNILTIVRIILHEDQMFYNDSSTKSTNKNHKMFYSGELRLPEYPQYKHSRSQM